MAGERDGLHSLAEPHLVAEEKPSVECKSGRHAIALEGQKFGLVDHSLARRSAGDARLGEACVPASELSAAVSWRKGLGAPCVARSTGTVATGTHTKKGKFYMMQITPA